ncbi:MAG: hypothetical protein ACRDT6_03320 [Micromonosporaceae bacterium]
MTDPSAGTPAPGEPAGGMRHQVRPAAAPPPYPHAGDPAALPPPPDPRLASYPHPAPYGRRPPPRPYDPLVPYDFSSWMDRVQGVVKRSWRGMLRVALVAQLVPQLIAMVVLAGLAVGLVLVLVDTMAGAGLGWSIVGVVVPIYLALLAVSAYLTAVSGRAMMRLATNDAVGQPLAPADALRPAWGSAGPTAGWLLLGLLGALIGIYLCYLPGIYVSVAASLITPVMAFERREGLVRSFRLVHSAFWPAAGRILAVTLAVSAVMSLVVTVFYGLAILLGSLLLSGDSAVAAVGAIVIGVLLFAVIMAMSVLGSIVIQAGYLVTYAELRGRLQPGLTAGQLAAEVNA